MYSHQKLSFTIILLLYFGVNIVSSFFKQCDYPIQDPNNIDKDFINMTKNINPKILPIIGKKINETIRYSINKANEKGEKACKNKYNIFLLEDFFVYFIVLAAVGYIIASFLKSYSVVKIKSLISNHDILTFINLKVTILNKYTLIYFYIL